MSLGGQLGRGPAHLQGPRNLDRGLGAGGWPGPGRQLPLGSLVFSASPPVPQPPGCKETKASQGKWLELSGRQPDSHPACLFALMLTGWWSMDVQLTATQVWGN